MTNSEVVKRAGKKTKPKQKDSWINYLLEQLRQKALICQQSTCKIFVNNLP